MIDYPNRIQDIHVRDKLRELIDAANSSDAQLHANIAAIAALQPPLTLAEIQQAIQLGGSNPINITGLQGTLANPQIAAIIGTHAMRLATAATLGAIFIETDRTSQYIGETVGASVAWVWDAGNMVAAIGSRPSDLGTNDTGFTFTDSTSVQQTQHVWLGSAWVTTGGYLQQIIDAVTNVLITALVLSHRTSGAPAANYGTSLAYELDSSTNVPRSAAFLDVLWTTATNGLETADFIIALMNGGAAAAEKVRITGAGNVGIGTSPGSSRFYVAGGSSTFDYSSVINGTAAGYIVNANDAAVNASPALAVYNVNNNANGMVGIQFIHANSSFSARVAAAIQATLSDVTPGSEAGFIRFATLNAGTLTEWMRLTDTGNAGFGLTVPTGVIHVKAGTAAANTAPFKFTAGVNTTAAEPGAAEWDGTNLFITQTTGPTRKTIAYTTDIPSFPSIKDTIALTGQTADIGTTNFANSSTAGTYQIDYYVVDPSTDLTAGTVQVTFAFTDAGGATTVVSAALALTAVGRVSGVFMLQLASGSISYAVAHTGIFGAATYNLYATLTRLS